MIMKRFLAVFLMLAILLTGLTVTANAAETGWVKKDGNWYYYKADGTMVTSDWVKTSGKWYYLGADGVMKQDEVFEDEKAGKYYAADADGAMIANIWFAEDHEEVYEDTKYSWTDWYYAGADGVLVRGWKQIGKVWYYFSEYEGYEPYMYSDGAAPINNKWYAFKHSGEMIVGWGQPRIDDPWSSTPDTNWVYANADGSLVEGWKKIDGKWYYFSSDFGYGEPIMVRDYVLPFKDGKIDWGWESNNPTVYGFNKSGAMVENSWFLWKYPYSEESYWFYFGKDGAAKKGWFQDKGKWYYLSDFDGSMLTGWITMDDGTKYYLDKDTGAMKTGWQQIDDIWYYFKESGAMLKSDWVKSGSKWYYLKDNGEMAKSETLEIKGKKYTFGADGAWIELK